MIDAAFLTDIADRCVASLRGFVDADWSVPAHQLDLSVAEVVAHVAQGCLWYSIDLAAGGADLQPVEPRVDATCQPGALLDTLQTAASILASVVATSGADRRGYHPMGSADPSGFAAMACDELLIHTDDVARGLGRSFRPPAGAADAVLGRLFPWVPRDGDPWDLLRWANGRIPLDDRPQLTGWAWHCAPLDEWDGSVASRP